MIIASVENMKRIKNKYGVVAISEDGSEEYSADAADYFMKSDSWVLTDSHKRPMILARKRIVADFLTWADIR